ncbi:hypothetical protein D0Z07_1895 [Hyphodiscus hymeniophilus]|uniref:Uncharacterized protein n=1 Tax=Hyphodiscus hymeniophilus TaxID=353542 RepID=A0A9P6VNW7_9HELO|nr:hypothetical protein D0Z07_1895 [Hyphodiscus hymeniophilus]
MSGSGGYYKYRCKYWLTYNCPNWVWVNNAPCAHCLAEGRDSDTTMASSPFRISHEVFVPQIENGSLHYIIMEIVAASDTDCGWAVKERPVQLFPTATEPSVVSLKPADGTDPQKISVVGLQTQ